MYQLRPFSRNLLFTMKRGIKSPLPFEHIPNKLRGGLPESDDPSVILLYYGDHESACPGQSNPSPVLVRLRSSNSASFAQYMLLLPLPLQPRPANGSRGDHSRPTELRRQYPIGCGAWMFQEHRITSKRHCHRWPFGASLLNPM